MVPVFGTDLAPETGGQRSVTQPFVTFRCPPFPGTKKVPVFWNRLFFCGTPFPISELLEWPARGQQKNLKQLAVFSLSTRCGEPVAFVPIYSIGEMVPETLAQSDLCY